MCTPIVIDIPQSALNGGLMDKATGTDAITYPNKDGTGISPIGKLESVGGGDKPPALDANGKPVRPPGGGPSGGPVAVTTQDQNTLLINSLTEMAHKFTDTTSSILNAQTDATNALKDGFLSLNQSQKDAMVAAEQLRQNTGQEARKANYSLSLSRNRSEMSQGNSSTVLTGSEGVPTNLLALGRAQLLGGQTA